MVLADRLPCTRAIGSAYCAPQRRRRGRGSSLGVVWILDSGEKMDVWAPMDPEDLLFHPIVKAAMEKG